MTENVGLSTENEIDFLAKRLDYDGDGKVSAIDFFETFIVIE